MSPISFRFILAVAVVCLIILACAPCSAEDWKKLAKDEGFWTEMEEEYGYYAAAVILEKEAETRLGWDQQDSSYRLVAAILNPEGAEELGRWRLWCWPETKITKISAKTYLKSGHKVSVKSEHIREEETSGGIKVMEFAMPQFKKHCIIEVAYQRRQGGFIAFHTHWFGGHYPTQVSKYRLVAPQTWAQSDIWHQGYITRGKVPKPKSDWEFGLGGSDARRFATFDWELHDLPGVGQEPYMPPVYDLIPGLTIGATEKGLTWDDVADWYWKEYLEKKVEPSPQIREVASKLTAGLHSKKAKLRGIYDYVRKTVRYMDIPLTESGICPNDPYQVLRSSSGDCKDQAVLTVTLARAVGLPARCALVRTRPEGTLDSRIAGLAHFDHMIVAAKLGEDIHWLDPTARCCSFGQLPTAVQGVKAFVVNEDGTSQFYLTPLATHVLNKTSRTSTVVLRADGSIEVNVSEAPTGEHARAWLGFLWEATEKEAEERLQSYIDSKCKGAILKDWSSEGTGLYGGPLEIDYSFEVSSYATLAGDMIVVEPSIYSDPSLCSAFTNEERQFPVSMPRMESWEDVISIVLPEGYEVQELPERVEMVGPLGTFSLDLDLAEDRLICTRSFAIETTECGVEKYPDLKQYLADVRKHWGSGVVLSRKM